MASDRTNLREPSAGQRRSPPAKTAARTPRPAPPTKTQALQQRMGNQGVQALMQNKSAPPGTAPKKAEVNRLTRSTQVVDISSGLFNPSEKVRGEIETNLGNKLVVGVIAKGIAGEGEIEVRLDRGNRYQSINSGNRGKLPLLGSWAQKAGGMNLNIGIKDGAVTGHATLAKGGSRDWLAPVNKSAEMLGGAGLKVLKLPKLTNVYKEGKLILCVEKSVIVEVGGFLKTEFDVSVENADKPKIRATADIKIGGVDDGGVQLVLDNSQGALVGQVSMKVGLKAFSGNVVIKYLPDGTIDIQGKATYNADKLSGQIDFVATDEKTANNFARDAIAAAGGEQNVQNAPAPAPVPAPNAKDKRRALAATGQLTFNLTNWFAGTVNVVVDGKGEVTVIGKIAPPAVIQLFPQRDWDKELVKLEVTASYGIPVLATLDLFANISLRAIAKLGPAVIKDIEVLGTYSTDPAIQKNIQISGSLNISAYAGLRLRVEGGAGVTLLRHRLKFGIGINVDVGVKAYADARPTIGYRDPGQFYISGTLEMVAQPVLGLGGEFFIELDAPWWSPVDDDRWAWPLFSKEWPLTDPIGLNAVLKDYILGSGQVPDITFQEPKFDASKFMTSMVDNNLPGKSGAQGKGQGAFKDDGSVPKPVVSPKKPAPPKRGEKPTKKGAPPAGKSGAKGKQAKPDPTAVISLETGLNELKNKEPYSKMELSRSLGALKRQAKGVSFQSTLVGDKWIVTPTNTGKKKQQGKVELKAKKEAAVSGDAQKGLAALDHVTRSYAAKGATLEEMQTTLKPVGKRFGFKSLTVEPKSGFWYYNYELSAKGNAKGPKVLGEPSGAGKEKSVVTNIGLKIELAVSFDMHGENHTLYTQVRDGKLLIEMASSQRSELLTMTTRAIHLTENDIAKARLERVYSKLKSAEEKVIYLIGDRSKDAQALAEAKKMTQDAAHQLKGIGVEFGIPSLLVIPHKSRFVETAVTGYRLKSLFHDRIRRLFYPSSYEPATRAWKRDFLKANTDPKNSNNFIDHVGRSEPKANATIDHQPRVVEHWESEGKNVTQAARSSWYSDHGSGHLSIIAGKYNSSDGAEARDEGLRYSPEKIGRDFLGPKET